MAVPAPRVGDPPDVSAAVMAALSNFRRRFDALDRSLATDRGFYLDIIV